MSDVIVISSENYTFGLTRFVCSCAIYFISSVEVSSARHKKTRPGDRFYRLKRASCGSIVRLQTVLNRFEGRRVLIIGDVSWMSTSGKMSIGFRRKRQCPHLNLPMIQFKPTVLGMSYRILPNWGWVVLIGVVRNDRIEEKLVRTLEQVGIDAKDTRIVAVGETEFQLPNGEFCLPPLLPRTWPIWNQLMRNESIKFLTNSAQSVLLCRYLSFRYRTVHYPASVPHSSLTP